MTGDPRIQLGLRENISQFSLLVLVNALVGAMVGLERSILPAIAEQDFELAAKTAMLSFIMVFGVDLELDPDCEPVSRHQPGIDLVDDGDHEDRPGRREAARSRDGTE